MIWLARHGETTWNLGGRYQGRMESPLSALGMRQGAALAAYFSERLERREAVPTRIVTSPLQRCTQTARFVATRLGVELESDARLIEIAHGTWEGRFRDELERNDPERYRAWREDPAHVAFERGETLTDVLARWRSFATDLVPATADALVVTHDAVVRCALLDLQKRPLADFWQMRVENAAFAELNVTDGRIVLERECVADHLRGLHADVSGQAL